MAKPINQICNQCGKRKKLPNLDCKGSAIVHPLPPPLPPKPPEAVQ